MSSNQYSGYGGNPYGDSNAGGGYGSNPYGDDQGYGQQNPYGGQGYGQQAQTNTSNPPYPTEPAQAHVLQPADPNGPQQPNTLANGATSTQRPSILSNADFLSRVEAAKADIRTLSSQVSSIASAHQRTLSSPDSTSSSALEAQITQTQVLNTSIKDQIKFLERDAAQQGNSNAIKNSQVGQLKSSFKKQLEEYRSEEASYERRYREQIARQYRIVNPDASEDEVREAQDADWGSEGVFQTALKTNRTATASTVLGAVRARHADIQRIERTLLELQQLFEQLAEEVVAQDVMVEQAEKQTEDVVQNTQAGNTELGKGVESARRARKLKWWCFWIVVLIVVVLALVLGLVFGLQNRARQTATGGARKVRRDAMEEGLGIVGGAVGRRAVEWWG
ncbi:syntaxin-like protein 2 [Elsinoe australis]|uniref:Syntaxin-like protein 2 n=1 Tax=Elsinoe australis TaxID=40998 RepID=A0A4U7AY21_9PEZI|nr:syntaxin-like protein 2 [Elsinoe australis]